MHFNIILPSAQRPEKYDFGLPPPCNWDIHSSWILCNVDWFLVTDVAEPVSCPEKSVTNYQSVLHNITEEPKSHAKSNFIPALLEKKCMHISSYWLVAQLRQIEIQGAYKLSEDFAKTIFSQIPNRNTWCYYHLKEEGLQFHSDFKCIRCAPHVWHDRCPCDTPIPAKPSQAVLMRSRNSGSVFGSGGT